MVLHREEIAEGRQLETPSVPRPKRRGDCLPGGCNEERPCPWVACRHHLAYEVDSRSGGVRARFPDRDLDELPETCVLDVADRGGVTLEETGELLNCTRERARQIEAMAMWLLEASAVDGVPDPERVPAARRRRQWERSHEGRERRGPALADEGAIDSP